MHQSAALPNHSGEKQDGWTSQCKAEIKTSLLYQSKKNDKQPQIVISIVWKESSELNIK